MLLCMENMPVNVAKVSLKVIDLSSDDEDTVEEKNSSGMHYLSELAVKQESPQSSKSQKAPSFINKPAVQSQSLSRSINHISESNLQDPEHDIGLKLTQQDGIVPNNLSETHVQGQTKEGNLRHGDGRCRAEIPFFVSLSDKDPPSVHETQNPKDWDESKQASQGKCHMPDSQSCHSRQKFQQIQNKMDMGGKNQGSKLDSQSLPKVGVVPPILPSTLNCLGINSKKNGSNQFWKAGDYDVQGAQKRSSPGGMYHVRVHPKFLHSNATSHKWAFGAIAELLDNAVDEIQNGATFVIVDKIQNPSDNSPALLFQDNGGGMDPDCMRQCMSLGYSVKTNSTTIGQCKLPRSRLFRVPDIIMVHYCTQRWQRIQNKHHEIRCRCNCFQSLCSWQVLAGVKPDEKTKFISKLQEQKKIVAMVGDGINDAAALAQSDVGIAMGGGVGAATEVASIVLMGDKLAQILDALELSKMTMRKIKQNLLWAFMYNIVGIPVAAGVLLPVTGTLLTPSIAGAMMGISSLGVMANSLALQLEFNSKCKQAGSTFNSNPLRSIVNMDSTDSQERDLEKGGHFSRQKDGKYA